MTKICIFCGEELRRWTGQSLPCGGIPQPVCENCWDRYSRAPDIQRARLALETGRALDPESIRQFLSQEEAAEAERARRRARQQEVLTCCGQPMAKEETYRFLDQTPFSLYRPLTPSLVLFRCNQCGQVKFFDAVFFSEEQPEISLPEPPAPAEPVRPYRPKPGQKPPWEK